MTTRDFFELARSGDLSELDMHNYVQQLTDNYDEDKLNLLCQEFDEFIQFEFEEWSSSYSKDFKQKNLMNGQKIELYLLRRIEQLHFNSYL
ncbi:MAG: hypothetical protein WD604_11985 [Balneolaceae bacterium]